MGWADCGTDSRGRRIGYAYAARCDEPGCHVRIDRGLAYACGGMHGEDEISCEGYFCQAHKQELALSPDGIMRDHVVGICRSCAKALRRAGWVYDREAGHLRERRAPRQTRGAR